MMNKPVVEITIKGLTPEEIQSLTSSVKQMANVAVAGNAHPSRQNEFLAAGVTLLFGIWFTKALVRETADLAENVQRLRQAILKLRSPVDIELSDETGMKKIHIDPDSESTEDELDDFFSSVEPRPVEDVDDG